FHHLSPLTLSIVRGEDAIGVGSAVRGVQPARVPVAQLVAGQQEASALHLDRAELPQVGQDGSGVSPVAFVLPGAKRQDQRERDILVGVRCEGGGGNAAPSFGGRLPCPH